MEAQHKVLAEPTGSWRDARLLVTDVFEAPKSKKTFNVCAIVAAAMKGGTVLNYSASLPPEKCGILYIDTEQSKFHCKRVLS